ncbi:hypothetical protein Bca4012_064452 [Brassica carinata]
MDGKTVILSVLIMRLVMAQNQVAAETCCPNYRAINIYNLCRLPAGSMKSCAKISGCIIVPGTICPSGYPYPVFENSEASEIMNGAVAQCTNACSTFCTKGSVNAVETA